MKSNPLRVQPLSMHVEVITIVIDVIQQNNCVPTSAINEISTMGFTIKTRVELCYIVLYMWYASLRVCFLDLMTPLCEIALELKFD